MDYNERKTMWEDPRDRGMIEGEEIVEKGEEVDEVEGPLQCCWEVKSSRSAGNKLYFVDHNERGNGAL
jgi:hypothetical protein